MQKRYRGATRPERSRLLDEMQAVTGPHRKSLTRLMAATWLASDEPGSEVAPMLLKCSRRSR
jgi:hypothetical protein